MKTIKKLTDKFAENYIHYNYGYLKHDIKKLVKASRTTAKQYNCSPLNMFFFMIENEPIREIKETFKNNY
tara:strand:+ start:42 stop:251 length:210 start_codon:yes stop_codon:yes gene_type:complete